MYDRQLYAREPRLTVSSVLLLAVFVSAVAVVIVAFFWQPWDTDGSGESTLPAVVEPAPEGDTDADVIAVPGSE